MKVLQVASSLYDWGGIERYVHYLDQGLTQKGSSVRVVCPPGSPLATRSSEPEALFANRAQFSVRTYLAFRRIGRSFKPDIAHIHFSPDFVMPALALRQTSQAKIVLTRHLVLKWSKAKVDRYTKLFHHIIPVSGAVERKLSESGVPSAMMTVAKAGVPTPTVEPSDAPAAQDLKIGVFGRLVKEKGVAVLIDAIAKSNMHNVEIYGEGPERPTLESQAKELGVGDRVRFHGFIPDVAGAMAAVDLVAVPSIWEEAFPYSILEAMSLGRAVVASNCGGIPEVVADGSTGRLFEKGSVSGLSAVLDELERYRPQLAKMGRAGMELQRSEYTIERMADRVNAVYRMVLESS